MSDKKQVLWVSIIGGLVNLTLAAMKIIAGILAKSSVLVAEGIHSLSDLATSVITYVGIKKSQKPADKDHPYGHEKYESIASLLIAVALIVFGIIIIYEATIDFWKSGEEAQFTLLGLILMAVSMLVNEITARVKFYFGNKFSSLALVADGQHDRMDVLVSLAVFVGLFLIRFYPRMDGILAIMVGAYIIYESYDLARASIDNLADAADFRLENDIKNFLNKNKIAFSEIKTRRLGSKSSVEIEVQFNSYLKLNKVSKILKDLEKKIKTRFSKVSQIIIRASSHNIEESVAYPFGWGKRCGFQKRIENIEIKPGIAKILELSRRIIIPIKNGKIDYENFGSKKFLVVDLDPSDGRIIQKKEIENPFWEKNSGHGIQFVKWIEANEVVTGHIGKNAENNLRKAGVKIIKISRGNVSESILKILKSTTKN